MPEHRIRRDHAETAVLPEHLRPDRRVALDDAMAEAHGRYREYVRLLDEVPVLVDVVHEPPRRPIKDFRLGQRPESRKAPRADAAALREQHAREVAEHYAEYVETGVGSPGTPRAGPHKAPARGQSRKGRAQKKRAKRAKRSARR